MLYLKLSHSHDEYFEENSMVTQMTPDIKRVLTSYRTGTGSWNVIRADFHYKGELTFRVDHTYSYFKSVHFMRDNLNYIISPAASYQQGIITCLDTKKIYKINHDGWCPVEYFLNKSANILGISGCFWAAPYEYRFYDIRDLDNINLIKVIDMEHDASNEQWIDDSIFSYNYIAHKGKDGKTEEDPPWKSHNVIRNGSSFEIAEIKDNMMFGEDGEYSKEFIDNFTCTHKVEVKL
jgi:hypothetical protein